MNFKNKLLTLLLSLTMLSGCNTNTAKQSSSSFEINESMRYQTTTWDSNVDEVIKYALGDAWELLPKASVDQYVASIDLSEYEDIEGNVVTLKTAKVLCARVEETFLTTYGNALLAKKFVYSEEYDCYYAKANPTDCAYVYLSYSNVYNSMTIKTYRKTIRYKEWFDDVPFTVLGENIPHIAAPAYEYYFEATDLSLTIYFVEVSDAQISSFYTELKAKKWTRTSVDATYDVYTSADGWKQITCFSGTDAFGDTYFAIVIENAWPYYLIVASVGEDIPKLENNTVSYDGYSTNQLSSGEYYTDIGYKYADITDYETYCNLLKAAGWTTYSSPDFEENPGSMQSDTYGTIYYSYFCKNIGGEYYYIDVMFTEKASTQLLIIIYA